MQIQTLGDLFAHPSFQTLFLTILIVFANIIIGVSMLPQDRRKRWYQLHRYVYVASIAMLGLFLYVNHQLGNNDGFIYFVAAYFLTAIPLSRKMNVTLHAVIASVGLVLLIGMAALSVL
ncbi:membrane hypothetical protein [Nitrospina gracilis 3/211]|uniref:Uncharacterized protein n=1 Tax=Nitrospina gracilis (strain 3/211) TaxID=1266370 RepID=M1Z0F1_NITG3|nr:MULTISPECIES: hypothetical protein [Nitrospina]MCF8724318.1 DUF1680 family protein [Nitrospina sp. Nb-3]CCQ91471.1 membrane hypothetical protein [Nitrospina gracilis 3/211]